MYSYYKTAHQSTGVEFCLEANFTGPNDSNLIIARTDVLEIYRLRERPLKQNAVVSGQGNAHVELVARYQLHGNVVGLMSACMEPGQTDLLFLACKEAKISVLSFNAAQHHIQAESLHWFEDDEIKNGRVTNTSPTLLRTDPGYRCAVMLCYGTYLAVIGIRRSGDLEETFEDNMDGNTSLRVIRPSYLIKLSEVDPNIRFVHDMSFLEGYFEPTLLILYESVTTWAGRVSARSDTVSIIAISINSITREHHVVWQMDGLPFDCRRLQPVPRPIGGVLVFGANELIYLNQSTPTYAVSVNEFAKSLSLTLEDQEGVLMTLDQSTSTFIAPDKMVLSNKSGDIYVVTLQTDGRNVKKFEMRKAGTSVIPSAICTLANNYLFIGSRVGDSLLIHYQEKLATVLQSTVEAEQEKHDDLRGKMTEGDLEDDLFIYDMAYNDTQQRTTAFSFKVCDSLINIGPIRHMCMGEPAYLSEEYIDKDRPDIEIVTCSGYGKNGSLCVLQGGIRPQVLSSFDLGEMRSLWTAFNAPTDQSTLKDVATSSLYHDYLVMSGEDSTMVFSTGAELQEVENPGLVTFGPTVHIGNLGGHRFVVQIHDDGLVLLEGMTQVHHITLEGNGFAVSAMVEDPYVSMLISDGTLLLYVLDAQACQLVPWTLDLPEGLRTTAACLYTDSQSCLVKKPDEEVAPRPKRPLDPDDLDEVDEDMLLYGEAGKGLALQNVEKVSKPSLLAGEPTKETVYLIVTLETGLMQIYSIGDKKVRFTNLNFSNGNPLVTDDLMVPSVDQPESDCPIVVEIAMYSLGSQKNYLYLMAVTDEGDLFIYKGFSFVDPLQQLDGGTQERLTTRFRKIQHEIILRKMEDVKENFAYGAPLRNGGLMMDNEDDKDFNERLEDSLRYHRRKLFPFYNIGGYNGTFVGGDKPMWIMCTRNGLRIHPMYVDGPVLWFSSFHNTNCEQGFVYFNQDHELRICQLNQYLLYDSPWPYRKVPIKQTPHYVCFHTETKTYIMAVSTDKPVTEKARSTNEMLEKAPEQLPRRPRYIYGTEPKFEIILITPIAWVVIGTHELEPYEHVTSMETVTLRSGETASGLKSYIAVATIKSWGEDTTAKGRVLLFEVIEVVPEPGKPHTNHKLKCVYDKEQKGPVTALTHVQGQLITAVGQKIFIWAFMDGNLVGRAFIDTMMYIQKLVTAKSFIMAADLFNSIYLMRYQEEEKSLSLITKDYDGMHLMTAGFVVDDFTLGMSVTDNYANYMIFHYMPEDPDSRGGTRLLRKADFHVGSRINTMVRIQTRHLPGDSFAKTCHINYMGTLDGSLCYVMALGEKVYRRLSTLQSRLTTQVQHVGGLNPRSHRVYQPMAAVSTNPCRNILDGDLLWVYPYLSISMRRDLARQIGTNPNQIIQDLQELDYATGLL